jgi:hypothetical protein
MEALKFAFDTLVIGALALPWLLVLSRMYSPPGIDGKVGRHLALVSALPEHTKSAVLSVMVLALGYFLGAAVSRISDDFFGDSDVLRHLPSETSIRKDVYYHEYCHFEGVAAWKAYIEKTWGVKKVDFCPNEPETNPLGTNPPAPNPPGTNAPGAYPLGTNALGTYPLGTNLVLLVLAPGTNPPAPNLSGTNPPAFKPGNWDDAIEQFFRLEEGKVLLQGDDKTTRLRELHDQLVILRGATLNGIILSTLCLFGFCASFRSGSARNRSGSLRNWRTFGVTHAAPVALILYGGFAIRHHFSELGGDHVFRDPPLAEVLMVLMGIGGLLAKAGEDSRLKYATGWGLSLALTIIAYGAWWWTEVIYNQGVIHSYPTLLS